MANVIFRGDAQDQKQISTHTVGGTAANGQVYTLICNLKEIAYTATGADTNTTIATALLALLQAAVEKEFQDADFTSSTNVISSMSKVSGVPYTFTSSATGTGTFVTATTQTAKGHEHWGDADNWSLGRVPAGECDAPVQSAASASSGGSLANGTTYYWVITATNALGETVVSNERSLAITAPNQTANLSWTQVIGATGYKIYRSTVSGDYTNKLLTSTTALTYADTGAATGAGTPPGANTAVGDDIYLGPSATSIKYSLPSDYFVPNSLHVDSTFTGEGGLPDLNVAGYYEYRQTYLKMAPKSVFFGENGGSIGGSCSPLFRIDKGSSKAVAFVIYQTGNPSTQGLPAMWIKGAHASDTYVMQQGRIGLAYSAGDAAQFTTLKVGYESSPTADVVLTIGAGCTAATITQLGGQINCNANVTTLTTASGSQGEFTLTGSATMGTATLSGGKYIPKTSGAHTAVNLNNGATLDHSHDIRAFNIGTLTLRDGCTFLDPAGVITTSNPVVVAGNLKNMDIDFGTNRNITLA